MTNERRPYARPLWGGLLIVVGAALLVQTTGLVPIWAATWFGATFLAAIGLGFLTVYLQRPTRWWPIIPAGVALTLAVVTAAGPFVPGPVSGAVFLLGLAVTFGAVALVPTAGAPRTWAWIPAGVLTVLAAITLGAAEAAVFWPLILIAAGVYFVAVWALRRRQPGG